MARLRRRVDATAFLAYQARGGHGEGPYVTMLGAYDAAGEQAALDRLQHLAALLDAHVRAAAALAPDPTPTPGPRTQPWPGLRILMRGETIGRPDRTLVCYVEVHGNLSTSWVHVPVPGVYPATAHLGGLVFDAQMGNSLHVSRAEPQNRPCGESGYWGCCTDLGGWFTYTLLYIDRSPPAGVALWQ
jgi:hypothetical protein